MNKEFEKIIEKLEEAKSNVPVNRLLDDIIKDKPKELGQLMAYNKAIEIVKQEEEQCNNGWIPCSEQLPEPIRPVLVTLKNWMNDKCFVRVGRFHTDHWKTDEGIVENSVVLAWKPLPQPYQPKGE